MIVHASMSSTATISIPTTFATTTSAFIYLLAILEDAIRESEEDDFSDADTELEDEYIPESTASVAEI